MRWQTGAGHMEYTCLVNDKNRTTFTAFHARLTGCINGRRRPKGTSKTVRSAAFAVAVMQAKNSVTSKSLPKARPEEVKDPGPDQRKRYDVVRKLQGV